jgi:predicted regulator of Ras-like GTPase activity (Roadblock/LC7/MglB family)
VSDITWDTPTMAELHYKQGHVEEAAEIYRRVLQRDPQHERARVRLAEIEAELASRRGAPMSFREHIQRIVQSTPGAIACTLMGFDGIAIDTFNAGDLDLTALMVDYTAAAQQLRNSSRSSVAGPLQELTIVGERVSLLLRPVSNEYFLAVLLSSRGLVGKARFLMRVSVGALAKELA